MVVIPYVAWVSLDYLEQGIARYHTFRFDPDFHNSRYARFLDWRKKGVTLQTWTSLASELRAWGALRGITDSDILRQEARTLESLDCEVARILRTHPRGEPDLDTAEWAELEPLFLAAQSINTGKGRPISSPVLPSKLAHFLIPGAFPVADGAFAGVASMRYPDYWTICKKGWAACRDREPIIARLRAEIEKRRSPAIPEYPWSAKITELCYAAYNHRQSACGSNV